MVSSRIISAEARKVLWGCVVEDDAISLPVKLADGGKLPRPLYEEVNSILESLGGKWSRGRQAHVFAGLQGDDLADTFYTIAETGMFERPQDAGFYPTPGWLSDQMIAAAEIEPHHRVLEPSAGQGAILLPLVKKLASKQQAVVCELLPMNRKALEAMGFRVDADDFMTFECEPMFDRIVANPPFSKSQATVHVRKMIQLLRPGGRLVVIMPSGIVQRQDRLHREVRQEIMRHGKITPLPDDSFRGAGTGVRAVLITYDKPVANQDQPFKLIATTTDMPLDGSQSAQAPQKDAEVTVVPSPRFRRVEKPAFKFRRIQRKSLRRTGA